MDRSSPAQTIRLQDVAHQTAQERVEDVLRQAILSGTFAPGTRLILTSLSQQLGVSRTPIREAMRALASEGLIDMDSFRSAVVHVPTLEEAREIYDLRLILEPRAVKAAVARITDEELDAAEAFHRLMLEVEDDAEWVKRNREFHAILLKAADSKHLVAVIRSLRNASAMQVALSLKAERSQIERSNIEHEGILKAFRDRDVATAVQLTKQHLRTTLDLVERYEEARRAAEKPALGA